MRFRIFLTLAGLFLNSLSPAAPPDSTRAQIDAHVKKEAASLLALYKDLHSHPELSFQEQTTSKHVAEEFKKAGCQITTGIGRYGVVGVLPAVTHEGDEGIAGRHLVGRRLEPI